MSDEQAPPSLQSWLEHQARVVMDLAGTRHSGWDGKIYERLGDGTAGPLRFSIEPPAPEAVNPTPILLPAVDLENLQEIFTATFRPPAGPPRFPQESMVLVQSSQDFFREQVARLRSSAAEPGPGHDSPSTATLAAGVRESWSDRMYSSWATDSGLAHPALLGRDAVVFAPRDEYHRDSQLAADAVVARPDVGFSSIADLTRLVRETPDRQFAELALIVAVRDKALAGQIIADPEYRAGVLATVERVLRRPLDELPEKIAASPPTLGGIERLSREAGDTAAQKGAEAVQQIAAIRGSGLESTVSMALDAQPRLGSASAGAAQDPRGSAADKPGQDRGHGRLD